jgi:hypothetical protein
MAALAHSGRDAPQRQFRGAQAKVHNFYSVTGLLPGLQPTYVGHATARRLEGKIHSLSSQPIDLSQYQPSRSDSR